MGRLVFDVEVGAVVGVVDVVIGLKKIGSFGKSETNRLQICNHVFQKRVGHQEQSSDTIKTIKKKR